MPAQYTNISRSEFEEFVSSKGFVRIQPVDLPNIQEAVYGKIVGKERCKDLCLRIYSGIEGESSRECGADAIRVSLVYRKANGDIRPVGKQRRVHRVKGWKDNLQSRIDGALLDVVFCSCGRPMAVREGANGKFWGCISFPECRNTKPLEQPVEDVHQMSEAEAAALKGKPNLPKIPVKTLPKRT